MIFMYHVQKQLLHFCALRHDAVSEARKETACINCGRCVSVCPGHVLPASLANLAERGDMAELRSNLMVWNAANAAAAVISVRQRGR